MRHFAAAFSVHSFAGAFTMRHFARAFFVRYLRGFNRALFHALFRRGFFLSSFAGAFPSAVSQTFSCSLPGEGYYQREKKLQKFFPPFTMKYVCIMFSLNPSLRSKFIQYHLKISHLVFQVGEHRNGSVILAAKGHLSDYNWLSISMMHARVRMSDISSETCVSVCWLLRSRSAS